MSPPRLRLKSRQRRFLCLRDLERCPRVARRLNQTAHHKHIAYRLPQIAHNNPPIGQFTSHAEKRQKSNAPDELCLLQIDHDILWPRLLNQRNKLVAQLIRRVRLAELLDQKSGNQNAVFSLTRT